MRQDEPMRDMFSRLLREFLRKSLIHLDGLADEKIVGPYPSEAAGVQGLRSYGGHVRCHNERLNRPGWGVVCRIHPSFF